MGRRADTTLDEWRERLAARGYRKKGQGQTGEGGKGGGGGEEGGDLSIKRDLNIVI